MWELEIEMLVDTEKRELQTSEYTFRLYWDLVYFIESHEQATVMPCRYLITNTVRWEE